MINLFISSLSGSNLDSCNSTNLTASVLSLVVNLRSVISSLNNSLERSGCPIKWSVPLSSVVLVSNLPKSCPKAAILVTKSFGQFSTTLNVCSPIV